MPVKLPPKLRGSADGEDGRTKTGIPSRAHAAKADAHRSTDGLASRMPTTPGVRLFSASQSSIDGIGAEPAAPPIVIVPSPAATRGPATSVKRSGSRAVPYSPHSRPPVGCNTARSTPIARM